MFKTRSFTPWRMACAALITLSALVFAGSLPGEAIWDDIPLINGTGTGGDSLAGAFTRPFLGNYFRPLVSVSFVLERPLWSSGPFGYHQTNLLIHAINTGLMISLLLAAFRCRRIAFVGATIFAFHPVHVSSVAWIGGRTDPMLCLFMTAAALCLIRSAQAEVAVGRKLGWAAFWFGLALLCKEQVLALLPLAPLAYRFFGSREWDSARKKEARKALYLFGGVSAVFILCWFLAAPPKQSLLANGFANYVMRAGDTLLAYTALLLAPNATWMHLFTLGPTEAYGWAGAAGGLAAYAGLGLFIWSAWKRGSQAAWWGLWMFLVLLPVSNLIPIATLLVAPYRAEIAQVALSALAGWGLVTAWDRLALPAPRLALATAGAAAGAWCLYLCVWGSSLWTSSEKIFGQICKVDPDCIFAREAVVQSLLGREKLPEASRELETLLERLLPNGRWRDAGAVTDSLQNDTELMARLRQNQGGSINPNVWLSNVYAQLGILRSKQRNLPEAETYLKTAVILDVNCFDALVELGFMSLDRGEFEQAREWADRAVRRGPTVADAWTLRGKSNAALGRLREAEIDFSRCVSLQPWAGQAYVELADVKLRLGDKLGAAATLAEALRKSPKRDDIRRRLASL